MTFYLIDLRSQVYAVEKLLAGKLERDILEWLKTKVGTIHELSLHKESKTLSTAILHNI